jgi:hypothetical protein
VRTGRGLDLLRGCVELVEDPVIERPVRLELEVQIECVMLSIASQRQCA